MINYYEVKSHQKISESWYFVFPECLTTFVMGQEEPYEGRLSRTVLWERRGETPRRDPTSCNLNYGRI